MTTYATERITRTAPAVRPEDAVECLTCDGIGEAPAYTPELDASGEIVGVYDTVRCTVCEGRGWLTHDEHAAWLAERNRAWIEASQRAFIPRTLAEIEASQRAFIHRTLAEIDGHAYGLADAQEAAHEAALEADR